MSKKASVGKKGSSDTISSAEAKKLEVLYESLCDSEDPELISMVIKHA